MSVINTNITALIGQQNLNRSASALQTAMERLSSGLRINSAKDDAAGQAIANRMSSQISGLLQAQRNANDGISMSQTAEGALNKINDNLQRIRELTVQAANGTNSNSDLESIQSEIGQRLEEINRISEETSFNGTKVLDETRGLKIQVGAYDGESITINLKQINQETLGLTGFNVDGSGVTENTAATADDLVLAGFTAGTPNANGTTAYSKTVDTPNTAATSADVFAGLSDADTVTYSGTSNGLNTAADGDYTYNAASDDFSFNVTGADANDVASHITPTAGNTTSATITIGSKTTDVVIAANGSMTNTNGEALYIDSEGNLTTTNVGTTVDATVDNLLSFMAAADAAADVGGSGIDNNADLSSATITLANGTVYSGTDGADIDVTGATISASSLAAEAATTGATTSTGYTIAAGGAVTDGGGAVFVDGAGALTNDNQTSVTTTYYAHADGGVTDETGAHVYLDESGNFTFDATTPGSRTENPLDALDNALKAVDSLRSDLGALQNRFESAIDNLSTTATNLSAARSRIEDADYAVEVGNMTRAQILQQAGTSVLAQANQVPQTVLSLLR